VNQTFVIDGDDLVLRVDPIPPGTPYEHRCTRAEFERVAIAIDLAAPGGISLGEIRDKTGVEWMEVATAIAFMKDRGMVDATPTRMFVPAPAVVELHSAAMAAYHELRERVNAD